MLASQTQRSINRALLNIVEAHQILANVRVVGWQPHVLLNDAYERLEIAIACLMDVNGNGVSPAMRQRVDREVFRVQ